MFAVLLQEIVASYRNPRAAARDVIRRVGDWREVALLFALGFALSSALTLAVGLLFGGAGIGVGAVATTFILSVVVYALVTGLVTRVGRMFGGGGELIEIAAVVAWHSLVTSILAPAVAFASAAAGPEAGVAAGAVTQIVVAIVAIWLLANFVAEAHGFHSVWRVAGALVAGALAVGLVLSAFLAMLMPR